jgi:hypothetical protein
MANAATPASGKLATVIAEAGRVIAGMAASAKDLNRLPTSTLWGMLGGGAFTLAGYVATTATTFLGSFAVVGPLAATVGITSGVLLARWINSNSGEAIAEAHRIAIERNREITQLLRNELNKPGNSKSAKDHIAKTIATLNDELASMGRMEYNPQIPVPSGDLKLLPAPLQNS